MRAVPVLLCPLLLLIASLVAADMPRPAALQPAVDFWTRVYSQVGTDGGLLHDRDNLDVVYDTLSFEENLWHPSRERTIRERRSHYRDILLRLAEGTREDLSAEEEAILSLWPEGVSDARLRRAADNIRFQLGQADRFREGLIRSGAWEPFIHEVLEEKDLPRELAALPHVESSFNPDAWSRVGAAGIWQFTRPTGKRFMQVDHVVDQRMDPFAATRAAARMLKHNYSVTDDWALAVTAYNHGLAGILRATRDAGSRDIAYLVENHQGRNWGFASRNFYAAFLAAAHVDRHAQRYFGDLYREEPIESITVELPFYTSMQAALDAFALDRETMRELNRGLRDPVWEGNKYLPRGYELRVPAGEGHPDPEQALARIDSGHRYFAQIPDREHQVRSGEALSTIAVRYNTTVRELMAMNNLRNADQIRAGQTLRLPVEGDVEPITRERYTVRRGDTLSEIAHRAGMSTSALAAANALDPERPIRPGMTLRVDGRAGEEVEVATMATTKEASPQRADEPGGVTEEDEAVEVAERNTVTDPVSDLTRQVHALAGFSPRQQNVQPPRAREPDSRLLEDAAPAISLAADVELIADPADYRIAGDNTIEIQAAETLGHYAEWLELRAADLRRRNNMQYGTPLVIGQRLELDLANVSSEEFEQRRKRYHRDLQATFFERYRIEDTETRQVESGESLWSLTRPNTDIPTWLLRQHNPDKDFATLRPGSEIVIPVVQREP